MLHSESLTLLSIAQHVVAIPDVPKITSDVPLWDLRLSSMDRTGLRMSGKTT